MSQNEEENVLRSTNSANSIASESLSDEFPSWPPAMTAHDPQELSSYRPMSMDNGPQPSPVTWLMPMDQQLSPSTMMQLSLGHEPQLQSSSAWPMTYEPNQQPMMPSQYHATQINYRPEMQPMPTSHDAVQINNYHRQMQPMPPPYDAVQINNYHRQMQPMPPPYDAVQINNYHRQMQPMPPPYDAVQINNYHRQMQPMPPSYHAVHINNYHRQMQPIPPMIANGGIPSTPTPWIGPIVPQNPSFLHRECCSFNLNTYNHGAPFQLALQQRQGVEQMQFEDPKPQALQSLLQQHRGVEQMQFEDPRSQTSQSLQEQQRRLVEQMQFEDPKPQALQSLQKQHRGVEQMQFEDPRSQTSQSLQEQHRRVVEQNMQSADPRPRALMALQQQQHRGVEQMQFEDPKSQTSQSLLEQYRRVVEQNMQSVDPRPRASMALQQQQYRGDEQMQFEDPRSQTSQSLQEQHRRGVEQMQFSDPKPQASQSLQQQHRGVEQMQFSDPRSQTSQSLQEQHRRGVEQNMQSADPRPRALMALQQQQYRGDEQMQFEDPRSQPSLSLQEQHRRGVEQNMQSANPRPQASQHLQQQQQQQQSPADHHRTRGRPPRPWTSFFQRPGNAAVGRTMALECRQGNGTIRYCSTCNALLPVNGKPPATHGENDSCKVTALLPDNCIPLFECYLCNVRIRMDDIAGHVATVCHDAVPDKDGERYMSFFCGDCNRVMYAPWSVFTKHRQLLHYTPGEQDGHSTGGAESHHVGSVPSTLDVMYALMRDFVLNGRDILLYACLTCKYMGPYSRNRRTRCAVCVQPGNKFYCEHCNVVFSALQADYDMHRFTFEHFYFMHHRRARSNAAVQPVDAGHTGGGRGRRRGRAFARAARGRGRGRAAGNGVANASER